jgi:hypothetical protein
MSEKLRAAAKAALDAMDYMLRNGEWYCAEERANALRAALAEPDVQDSLTGAEPVACVGTNGELMWLKKPSAIYSKPRPLYTAPPRREWVGLTDDEIEHLRNDQPWWMVRDIEAKLREKNT